MLSEFLQNVRLALKAVRTERAFSGTVLLTLAVVIGANVAIFSVINAVILEPLPYDEPEELVTLYNSYPGAGVERASTGSYDFFVRRERIEAFEEVALLQEGGSAVGEAGSIERVPVLRVTPSIFPLIGVEAAAGRTFLEEEMDSGNQYKVILSDGFWREHFAGAPDVVGQDLRMDGRAYSIVGVAPPDFSIVGSEDARLFLPLMFNQEARSADSWHTNNYEMIARLRSGATIERAQSEIDALNLSLMEESTIPGIKQLLADVGYTTLVVPTQEVSIDDIRPTLFMLWAGVGFVLLIGCVNIANLMLARSRNRLGEIATRLALGASKGRVAAQILTESLVISVLGGAAGVVLGILGLRLLTGLGLQDLPHASEIGVNGTVLTFTLLITLITGVLFAAFPIAGVVRRDLSGVFRQEGRNSTTGRSAVLLRNAMVTSQVGLAFVLLVGAGLMLMSFRAALAVEPGFSARGLMTAFISLPGSRYPDADSRRLFVDEVMRELAAIPGAQSVSMTSHLPFSGSSSSSVIYPEGYLPVPGESLLSPSQSWVGPDYFETMGIEILQGRGLGWEDGPEQPRTMVVDKWLADRYWPDRSPIGQRMVYGAVPGDPGISEENLYTIVGVVENIKQFDLTAPESEHVGGYYFSALREPFSYAAIAVRSRDGSDPSSLVAAVRSVVTELDPELPLFDVEAMDRRIDLSLASRRATMTLLLVFATIALFLAVIGIYGALNYAVTRRTREMGIRMALGSERAGIFRMILGNGFLVAAVGLAFGIAASVALTRLMASLLFGVQPLDPALMASVAVILAAAALAASAIPAWNAARVDPVGALRGD